MHGQRVMMAVAGGFLGLGCGEAVPAPRPAKPEHVAWRGVEAAPTAPRPAKPRSGEIVCREGTLAECRERCIEVDAAACRGFGARICREGSALECQAACDADNPAACAGLAELYQSGRLEKNEMRRLDLLTRACRLGELQSCDVAFERYYLAVINPGDPSPSLPRRTAKTRAVEVVRTACERRLAGMGAADPASGTEYFSAAGVTGYYWCPASWEKPVIGDASCAALEGTACDILAAADRSSHAMLAAACETNQWMACRALAREGPAAHGEPAYVLALRKLCEHYTAVGNHSGDYCGRLKDLGHEAAR